MSESIAKEMYRGTLRIAQELPWYIIVKVPLNSPYIMAIWRYFLEI